MGGGGVQYHLCSNLSLGGPFKKKAIKVGFSLW